MAEMIPYLICDDATRSPGERDLFRRLRDDPETDGWLVFHSYEVARHCRQVSGEIDFLIIAPGLGVLALEVKAHRRISRKEGVWYFGSDPQPTTRSPFTQAEEAMHSLRQTIVSRDTRLSEIPFFSAVIFTHGDFEQQSPEWHPWQLITRRRYRMKGVGACVTDVFKAARKHLSETATATWFRRNESYPQKEHVLLLREILRPDFEVLISPKESIEQQLAEIRKYTQEQFMALDSLSSCERILFTGPAGTGKSVLAMESARRAAMEGRKVLFICFSNRLSRWLKEEMKPLGSKVEVSTLHGKMLSISGLKPPTGAASSFWNSDLPEAAWEALADRTDDSERHDLLIIDEVQDITQEAWFMVLDELLKGGLCSGNWHFFGDFSGQSIFCEEGTVEEQVNRIKSVSTSVVHYQLKVNCRNRKPTAEHAMRVGRLENIYSMILRDADPGARPEYHSYQSSRDQVVKVSELINRMLKEGTPPGEIVVLSPRRDDRSVASEIESGRDAPVAPLDRRSARQVGYTTIHSFKGLEAPIIIITDVDELQDPESRKLLYTATTRSTDSFHIFLSPEATRQLPQLLIGK